MTDQELVEARRCARCVELEKACAEEKAWSEELAHDICEMEDALGFKQDQHDKNGAFVPTKGAWIERVRDLIYKESELEDAKKACAEMREALEGAKCNCAGLRIYGNPDFVCSRCHALSTSCGKGYVHVKEIEPLLEALELCDAAGKTYGVLPNSCVSSINKALTHAENLLKGETK